VGGGFWFLSSPLEPDLVSILCASDVRLPRGEGVLFLSSPLEPDLVSTLCAPGSR
jgi:hypothetical protein